MCSPVRCPLQFCEAHTSRAAITFHLLLLVALLYLRFVCLRCAAERIRCWLLRHTEEYTRLHPSSSGWEKKAGASATAPAAG